MSRKYLVKDENGASIQAGRNYLLTDGTNLSPKTLADGVSVTLVIPSNGVGVVFTFASGSVFNLEDADGNTALLANGEFIGRSGNGTVKVTNNSLASADLSFKIITI